MTSGLSRYVLIALALCTLRWPRPVHAQATRATRVVLIDPGPELERAARAALEPWQVEIRVISVPSPGASAPSLHSSAEELARNEQAGSVAWISEQASGYALWIYDASTRQAVARPLLTSPPLDAPNAAAVALSLKTMLRHSQSAPARERYGATPAPEPAVSPPPAPAPSATRAPPPATARAHAGASRVEPDVAIGARFRYLEGGSEELRVGLGVSFWPRGRWAGIALRVAFGPSMQLREPYFQGSFSAVSVGVAGRVRWEPVRWLRGSLAILVLTDITRLDGVAVLEAQRIPTTWRGVPALGAEAGLDWLALPWLRVGLRGGPTWLLRTQDYALGATSVLALSRIAYEATLALGFGYHDP